jgi:hypothetical protein
MVADANAIVRGSGVGMSKRVVVTALLLGLAGLSGTAALVSAAGDDNALVVEADGAVSGWTDVGPPPGDARQNGELAASGSTLFIAGGIPDQSTRSDSTLLTSVRSVVAFDIESGAWSELAPVPDTIADPFLVTDLVATSFGIWLGVIECAEHAPSVDECSRLALRPHLLSLDYGNSDWVDVGLDSQFFNAPITHLDVAPGDDSGQVFVSTAPGGSLVAAYRPGSGWANPADVGGTGRTAVCALGGQLLVATYVDQVYAEEQASIEATGSPGSVEPTVETAVDTRRLLLYGADGGLSDTAQYEGEAAPVALAGVCSAQGLISAPSFGAEGVSLLGTPNGWEPFDALPIELGGSLISDDSGLVVIGASAIAELDQDRWLGVALPEEIATLAPDDVAVAGGAVYLLLEGADGQRLLFQSEG